MKSAELNQNRPELLLMGSIDPIQITRPHLKQTGTPNRASRNGSLERYCKFRIWTFHAKQLPPTAINPAL